MPKLGAARTPYSRTVKPGPVNAGALPDPEAIYEAVMARDGFKKNPNNVSSILWYWATIVIHGMEKAFFLLLAPNRAGVTPELT